MGIHTSRVQKLRSRQSFNKLPAVLASLGFALVGTILLFNTHAATPFASVEPETSTISANVRQITGDTTASSGSYVAFGSAPSSIGQMFITPLN